MRTVTMVFKLLPRSVPQLLLLLRPLVLLQSLQPLLEPLQVLLKSHVRATLVRKTPLPSSSEGRMQLQFV